MPLLFGLVVLHHGSSAPIFAAAAAAAAAASCGFGGKARAAEDRSRASPLGAASRGKVQDRAEAASSLRLRPPRVTPPKTLLRRLERAAVGAGGAAVEPAAARRARGRQYCLDGVLFRCHAAQADPNTGRAAIMDSSNAIQSVITATRSTL